MLKKENISSQLIVLNVINEVKYMNFGIYRYHLVQIFVLVFVPPLPCRLLVNYYESQMSSKTCRHVLIRVRSTYLVITESICWTHGSKLEQTFTQPSTTTSAVFLVFTSFKWHASRQKTHGVHMKDYAGWSFGRKQKTPW